MVTVGAYEYSLRSLPCLAPETTGTDCVRRYAVGGGHARSVAAEVGTGGPRELVAAALLYFCHHEQQTGVPGETVSFLEMLQALWRRGAYKQRLLLLLVSRNSCGIRSSTRKPFSPIHTRYI